MSLPTMNGTGRLLDDPELRYAASGGAVVKVRLAFNSRKKDPNSGEWRDDASLFITGTAFGQVAENIAASVSRGMEVVVSGRLKTESWEDRETGGKRSAVGLLVDSVGPSLRSATARVEKSGARAGAREEVFQQARGGQSGASGDDPWAAGAGAGVPASGGWGGAGGGEEPPF